MFAHTQGSPEAGRQENCLQRRGVLSPFNTTPSFLKDIRCAQGAVGEFCCQVSLLYEDPSAVDEKAHAREQSRTDDLREDVPQVDVLNEDVQDKRIEREI